MAVTKTEQGRLDRVAEKEARAATTQSRRDKTAEAQARSEQRKGPNPSNAQSTMDQREAAAGLNLAGNDTMSGRRGGISIPTMDQRESAAGLTGTTAGREDSFYSYQSRPSNPWQSVDSEAFAPMSLMEFKDEAATPAQGNVHPFQIVPFLDGSTWKVRIRYGTVNGEVPEIGSTELDPILEDGPTLTIPTGGGTIFVYLKVTISGSTFLMTDLTIAQAASLPNDTSTEGHLTIAILTVSGGEIAGVNQQLNTIAAYAYGGGTNHQFFTGSA